MDTITDTRNRSSHKGTAGCYGVIRDDKIFAVEQPYDSYPSEMAKLIVEQVKDSIENNPDAVSRYASISKLSWVKPEDAQLIKDGLVNQPHHPDNAGDYIDNTKCMLPRKSTADVFGSCPWYKDFAKEFAEEAEIPLSRFVYHPNLDVLADMPVATKSVPWDEESEYEWGVYLD